MNTCIIIGPNASLNGAQAGVFFALTTVLVFGIAGVLAALGFWPVLPFAGMELAALGMALWVTLRRNRYREVIRFEQGEVCVEIGEVGRGAGTVWRMPRGLARAWVEEGPHLTSPTRLLLGCAERTVEVGRCLTDEERARLCRRLKDLLSPAWSAGRHTE